MSGQVGSWTRVGRPAVSRWLGRTGLILAALFLVSWSGLQLGIARVTSSTPDRYLVLIVVDGFRPDYADLAPMHHLQMLMRSGMTYNRAWVGQLETETPTGHATIVTGVYPKKHGVLGFGWRDLQINNFNWMPTDLRQLNAGDMERLIEGGGAPTISDLVHQRYPGSKTVGLSGEKYYAADAMGTGADYVLYGKALTPAIPGRKNKTFIQVTPIGNHVPPQSAQIQKADVYQEPYSWVQDQFAAGLAVRLLHTSRPRALLVNLPGTDIEGHVTGGIIDQQDMRTLAKGVDHAIGLIMDAYKQAGLFNKTDFVVTADHGMVPNTHIVPTKAMYAAIRNTNAPALEDDLLTTGGYVYLRNPSDAPRVASELAAQHFPSVEGALYKAPSGSGYVCKAEPGTAAALGPAVTRAYIDLCNTMASPSSAEVVLPYAEDAMGLTVDGSKHWGNHGGFSWRVQHIPLVISGPGVRHGVSAFPAQLVDIAPTIERLMDLPIPSAVDGVVLADLLRARSQADVAAQKAVDSARAQDVTALARHSAGEHGAVLTHKSYGK
jgi:arylsulfatase A-like enzyme